MQQPVVVCQAQVSEAMEAAAKRQRRGELLFSRALADAAGSGRSEAPSLKRDRTLARGEERLPGRLGGERSERTRQTH